MIFDVEYVKAKLQLVDCVYKLCAKLSLIFQRLRLVNQMHQDTCVICPTLQDLLMSFWWYMYDPLVI